MASIGRSFARFAPSAQIRGHPAPLRRSRLKCNSTFDSAAARRTFSHTRTAAGLKIRAELDAGLYPTGIKVTDSELDALNLKRADFHGDWNYTLLPKRRRK